MAARGGGTEVRVTVRLVPEDRLLMRERATPFK
jgi:hypothetical protein